MTRVLAAAAATLVGALLGLYAAAVVDVLHAVSRTRRAGGHAPW